MKGLVSFEKELDIELYPNEYRSPLISIKNENDMIIFKFKKELPGYSIKNGWKVVKNIQ